MKEIKHERRASNFSNSRPPKKRKESKSTVLSLTDVKVTDIHCFAFPNQPVLTTTKLAEIFSLGGPTVSAALSGERIYGAGSFLQLPDYSLFLNNVSKFLRCTRETQAFLDFRNKKSGSGNFATYVSSLFENVNLTKLCLDDGLYPLSLEQLQEYVHCKLYRVTRIENIIKKLLEGRKLSSYQELVEKYEDALNIAVQNDGAIAYKSIIAYRSGLDIDPSEDEKLAEKEFEDLLRGRAEIAWFGPVVPKIRNSLLIRAIKKAGELGIFFEVHTGLGDSDIIGSKCNPILLQGLFKDKRVSNTKIVLIHCGYPYTIEAAWLARDFPNIFVETSTCFPPAFTNTLAKRRFWDIMSMAPPNRIVYGSDCFDLPELHWLSAKLAKLAFSESLGEMVARELINEDESYSRAQLIFSGNADSLIRRS